MRLSILDQSPVISGHSPAQAIAETLALARRAEALGYHRYWLAEHHAIAALADPCPEVLHIGRAPGGDARTARAVGGGRLPDAQAFPQQVWELANHLAGTLPEDHPERGVRLQPGGDGVPQIWLLGSSDYSGALASQLGLRFAFAHFINPRGGDQVMRLYKERYQPSALEPRPRTLLSRFVICAESDAEAGRLARVIDVRRLEMAYSLDTPVPTLEQASKRDFSEKEYEYIRSQRGRIVLGSPETCQARLLSLASQYSADELMVLTITGDYASRARSYELLAGVITL